MGSGRIGWIVTLGLCFVASRLEADLVARWEFDANLLDSAGGHDGTFLGGDTPVYVDGQDGEPAGALLFDGAGDVVEVAAAGDLDLTGDFTFSFWIQLAVASQPQKYLLAKNGGGSQFAVLYGFTADKLDFFAPAATGTNPRDGGASEMPLTDTGWHHVAYSKIGSSWSGYFDGAPIFSIDRSFNLNSFSANWYIGAARADAANAVNAAMDDVRIYNSGLTAQNISDIYNGIDNCPVDGDTHATALDVVGPEDNEPGIYTATATAVDDSGDPIVYTFSAASTTGAELVVGPQSEATAELDLPNGTWTISVRVDDDEFCTDEAVDAVLATDPFEVAALPRLIARWELDGDLVDSAGGHDGTFHGGDAPLFGLGFDGTPEGAVVFDGVNDVVEVPHAKELAFTDQFTWVFWFKSASTDQSQKYLIARNVVGNQYALIYEYVDNTVELFAASSFTGTDPRSVSGMGVADTDWHLVAYTYDGATLSGYLDGAPVFSTAIQFALKVFESPWWIGAANSTANFTAGAYDDIRMYNYGLSAAEVAELYSVPVQCPDVGDTRCTGLTVEGPEDGGQGTYIATATAEDDSGDPIIYTFRADDGAGQTIVVGPQGEASAEMTLSAGTWGVSVTVDDDPVCPDDSGETTCTTTVEVLYVPALMARYAFDGDLMDAAGANDGAFFGGEAPAFVDGYDGTPGGALSVDGVDDYVQIAPSPLLAFTNTFTFAFWFQSASVDQSETYLVSRNDSIPGGSGKQYAIIYEYADNKVDFYAPGRSSGDDPRAGGASEMPLADTEWHHIAYTYDGSTWSGYVDGAPVFSTAITFVLDTFSSSWWIGAANPNGNFVNGAFDEVRLYNYALTGEEVAELASVAETVGPFVRGDSNGDGVLDISDASYTLNYLYLGGPAPACLAAADSNGEGVVDLSDPVYGLNFGFLGGTAPPAPYPDCDASGYETDLSLGCETPLADCP